MNNLRKKIMDQLDRITAMNPAFNIADYDERYDEVVDELEALVIGYSVDVTSDTLSDIAAVDENLEGYDLQDDELV